MSWSKCPICKGKALLPHGFYDLYPPVGSSAINLQFEKCRACNNGVIFDFNPENSRVEKPTYQLGSGYDVGSSVNVDALREEVD